jgi:hypothetical protein
MEKAAIVLASPPQDKPSDATPHKDWFGRAKVSAAITPPDGSVVEVVVLDEEVVVVLPSEVVVVAMVVEVVEVEGGGPPPLGLSAEKLVTVTVPA